MNQNNIPQWASIERVAYQNLKNGLFGEAIQGYSEVINLNPNYAAAYINRGNCFSKLEKHEQAMNDYEKAIELNPLLFQPYENLGLEKSSLKRYSDAILDFEKAIKLKADKSSIYYNLGKALYEVEKFEEAVINVSTSLHLNASHEESYLLLGMCKAKLNKHEEAIEDYNKSLSINPQNYRSYNYKGMSYIELDKIPQAIQNFIFSIKINPNNDKSHNNLGAALGKIHKHEEAIAEFTKAIEINPDFDIAYNNRGQNRIELGKLKEAIIDFTKAIELNPYNYLHYSERAYAYKALGEYKMAILDYNKALLIYPNNVKLLSERGQCFHHIGDLDSSTKDYSLALGYVVQIYREVDLNKQLQVYKYRPLNEYAIKSIIDQKIYFSSPFEFDDANDCPIVQIDSKSFDLPVQENLLKVKLFSLSTESNNKDMWSKFADNQKGMVIGYSFDYEFLEKNLLGMGNVIYQNQLEIYNTWHIYDFLRTAFFIKNVDYEGQNEVRLIYYSKNSDKKGCLIDCLPDYINQIIFGIRCEEKDIEKVRKIIEPYKHIRLYKQIYSSENRVANDIVPI